MIEKASGHPIVKKTQYIRRKKVKENKIAQNIDFSLSRFLHNSNSNPEPPPWP